VKSFSDHLDIHEEHRVPGIVRAAGIAGRYGKSL
jgi:hypothetical protein